MVLQTTNEDTYPGQVFTKCHRMDRGKPMNISGF